MDKIKLIIWDLDDTFWQGTISEGEIKPNPKNISLVRELALHGVMSSICSKNDFEVAKKKLIELDIWDYFIFPSIDWTNKGERVGQMLDSIHLQAKNTLFVDDNKTNLAEVKFYSPEIHTALPEQMYDYIKENAYMDKPDKSLFRLRQYKIMESAEYERKRIGDDRLFLEQSNIKCEIIRDWENETDRAYKILQRTSQLNFTKRAATKESVREYLTTADDSGLIRVVNKYGDYGFVGFFALRKGELQQFAFSCRIMGMGVEQFVYATLGFPKIKVTEPVTSILNKIEKPGWIS